MLSLKLAAILVLGMLGLTRSSHSPVCDILPIDQCLKYRCCDVSYAVIIRSPLRPISTAMRYPQTGIPGLFGAALSAAVPSYNRIS